MKKIVLICTLAILSFNSISQTCEEREGKLLATIGGVSATMLYNTYVLIDGAKDAFLKKIYDTEKVTQLMNSQKGMFDFLIKTFEDNLKEKVFSKEDDKNFIESIAESIKGLKNQSVLLLKITEDNSASNTEAYTKQKEKNWTAISSLLGIAEE